MGISEKFFFLQYPRYVLVLRATFGDDADHSGYRKIGRQIFRSLPDMRTLLSREVHSIS